MKVIDRVRTEINAAIHTLSRRRASSADEAEKVVILRTIESLYGELSLLNQAAQLQVAGSIAIATQAIEYAIASARSGPFDGYLATIESHLTKLNFLAGHVHAGDSLESAVVRPAYSGSPKGRKGGARARGAMESAPGLLTSTVFGDLKDEYASRFDRCEVHPEFAGNVAYYVKRLRQGEPNYELVESEIGVPWVFVGIIHGMECGFNFAGHLHNGDKLTARTVNTPKGRPMIGEPPFTWLESALDAMRLKKLDQVTDWSVPHMLYLLEAYNGFGYRRRGLPSPYLWSFSNLYERGRFVASGKFDPEAVSKQCGAALMLKAIGPAGFDVVARLPPAAVSRVSDVIPQYGRPAAATLSEETGGSGGGGSKTSGPRRPGGGGSGRPRTPKSQPRTDVQFTARYPKTIAPKEPKKLLAYVHVPEAWAAVQADAEERLGSQEPHSNATSGGSSVALPPDSTVTIRPSVAGCIVEPEEIRFRWSGDWHGFEFKLQIDPKTRPKRGALLDGEVRFYLGPVLLSAVPASTRVESQIGISDSAQETRSVFKKIFASYSHADTAIVEVIEAAFTAIGDTYFRDVKTLRAGEVWNKRLMELIDEADVFQLFWSDSASASRFVEQEWRHALKRRTGRIAPMYWTTPKPDAPAELNRLHFAFLPLELLAAAVKRTPSL